ncbi:hypothetical protein DTO013E5_9420 [Penicillium roqueforti]|nr:hypothetical protein DTO012A1_9766 [Penicillium roqueforti]KAI2739641.1 hypothetical protein DTO013F2_9315 [Penicillium roqueforti]KAI2766724.1 hypothetical protein DTO012A8_8060 [Penicillium roqueforti]KAI3067057.1 hypothetical protein CBS147339_8602 [Penicillium roqueforti]KAI3091916.1 hypothetical protein CBS147338_8078 [Penicillium roqueforti]
MIASIFYASILVYPLSLSLGINPEFVEAPSGFQAFGCCPRNMFLVLEFRVHEDSQDIDMVLGLNGLSLDSETPLLRFSRASLRVASTPSRLLWVSATPGCVYLLLQEHKRLLRRPLLSGSEMAGREQAVCLHNVRDPFCYHGSKYLAQRREERNWPPCKGVVSLVRLFERYDLRVSPLCQQHAFFQ